MQSNVTIAAGDLGRAVAAMDEHLLNLEGQLRLKKHEDHPLDLARVLGIERVESRGRG